MRYKTYIIIDEETKQVYKEQANCLESALEQVKKKNISKCIRVVKSEYS